MMTDRKHHLQATIHAASIVLAVAALPAGEARAQNALQADAETRARLGIEAGVGAALGDTHGGAFGLTGQLGVQASDLFAIYWQPGLYVDGWAASDDDLDVYVFGTQLAMLDFTLQRWFQVGLGGGIDIGKFGLCTEGNDPECAFGDRQVRPAANGRLAFIIPLPGIRARWGIPIAFNAHATFFDGQQIYTLTGGTGLIRF
jgi:hypothetical protein